MNGQDMNSRRKGLGANYARLSAGNVIGDPFALGTLSISSVSKQSTALAEILVRDGPDQYDAAGVVDCVGIVGDIEHPTR